MEHNNTNTAINDADMTDNPPALSLPPSPSPAPRTPPSNQEQQVQADCQNQVQTKVKDIEKGRSPIVLIHQGKRGAPFNFDTSPSLPTRFLKQNRPNVSGDEMIEEARQLLIRAIPTYRNEKQDRAQDLLAQFQAFQQGSPLATATAKLERQIHTL